jgi:hypothetical protein
LNIETITDIFSNREISIIIWIIVLITLFSISKEIRKSSGGIFSAIFDEKIVDILLLMFIYTELMILILTIIEFWNFSLLKDTIYWVLLVGFPLLLNMDKINKEENHIKSILKNSIKGIIIIEFITNFYNFSLISELILIPIITFISLLQVVSKTKPEWNKVYNLLTWVLAILGISVFIYSVNKIYQSPEGFFNILTLQTFLLPVILTILFIPFLYLVALYSLYETVTGVIGLRIKKEKHKRYLKRKMFLTFGLNRRKLKRFQKEVPLGIMRNKKEIKKVINDFNKSM